MVYEVCEVYNCPPPYDPLQILYLTIGLLALIPFLILVKNYFKLGTKEYLIFGGFFLSVTINLVILFVKPWNINLNDEMLPPNLILLVKIEYISFNLTYFFLYLHSYRLLWEKPPRFITLGWSLFSLLMLALIVFTLPSLLFVTIWVLLSELYRLSAGLLGVLAYRSVQPINPTYRIQRITRMWKWVSGLTLFNGIFQMLILVLYGISWNPILLSIRSSTIITLGLISLGVACYIAIIFPESMLVSHAQLARANKLYVKVKEIINTKAQSSTNPIPDDFTKYLISIGKFLKPVQSEQGEVTSLNV